ncbi:MAG: DUF4331 family protein [Microscillaceae bacterium]|nr:DUF4331 family protein [Microscillaceae bacterium]
MKINKIVLFSSLILSSLLGFWMIMRAADHVDAPAVTDQGTDITDVYAFRSPENNANLVFVCNVQGLMSPAETATATFDEDVMIELNIDNTGDNVEDLVIQAIFENGNVIVYGPAAPQSTGLSSTLLTSATKTQAQVTPYNSSPIIGTNNGIKVFAGFRDDPFFFDLTSFRAILAGTQSGFNNPGTDTFAGTNVRSLVVEVPKSLLGNAATLNVWAETKTEN